MEHYFIFRSVLLPWYTTAERPLGKPPAIQPIFLFKSSTTCYLLLWNIYFNYPANHSEPTTSLSLFLSPSLDCGFLYTAKYTWTLLRRSVCSNKAKKNKKKTQKTQEILPFFWQSGVAVVLLTTSAKTTDCLLLQRKIGNTLLQFSAINHHCNRTYQNGGTIELTVIQILN